MDQNPDPTATTQYSVPRRNKVSIVLAILTVLLFIMVAALGWMLYASRQENVALGKELKAKNATILNNKSSVAEVGDDIDIADDEVGATIDTDQVINTAIAYVKAQSIFTKESDLKATITKRVGEFALLNVYDPTVGPNITVILKKTDLWVGIFAGPNSPSQAQIDTYSIPDALLTV
jgi:hypothetical protein